MAGRAAATVVAMALLAAASAHAQIGGGSGGGHGGRGGGHGGQSASKPSKPDAPASPRQIPVEQIEIVGVITAIDRAADRVTIAYEPVEALDWPKGAMPFPVTRSELLKDATVGEKVRFKLDSHQIYELKPY